MLKKVNCHTMVSGLNTVRLTILLITILSIGCSERQSSPDKQWFRGNLHTHSYWSDGDEFPEAIMDWYKSKGYNFVALSDHNILAEGDKWVTIREDTIYQNGFKDYLKNYGSDWVIYKEELDAISVKLKTLKEYRGRFEESGKFIIIQSEEISDQYEGKPIHLNATNIQNLIKPQGGNSVAEVLQNNINAVIDQREGTGVPMIPHVNHPNFGYALSLEDMIALRGERFFEVYNGHPMVHNMGDSLHMSTEEMWDLINRDYIESNLPVMYGLATDDSHHYHVKGSSWSNAGRGWIMVRARTLNPESLIDAMESGEFYASSGVRLKDVTFENNLLSIEVDPERDITYTISFIGCKKEERSPQELLVVDGNKASFAVTNNILFVRCKITSSKLHENPIENLLYETAWTQPVVPQL